MSHSFAIFTQPTWNDDPDYETTILYCWGEPIFDAELCIKDKE